MILALLSVKEPGFQQEVWGTVRVINQSSIVNNMEQILSQYGLIIYPYFLNSYSKIRYTIKSKKEVSNNLASYKLRESVESHLY
ncbi:MAG: hypothetical protein ACXAC8_03715 [Candidatus Hodarchaeales archaeon]|jgi:hypothetical protein